MRPRGLCTTDQKPRTESSRQGASKSAVIQDPFYFFAFQVPLRCLSLTAKYFLVISGSQAGVRALDNIVLPHINDILVHTLVPCLIIKNLQSQTSS